MKWKLKIFEWTGFEYAICVHSGTSAIDLVMDVLSGQGKVKINLPAIACWTISGTLTQNGHQVDFYDVDQDLCLKDTGSLSGDILYTVEPWGNLNNWERVTHFKGKKVADLTLSVFSSWPGRKPADYFEAAVISCGHGKPLDIGAGGIALFKNKEYYEEARKLLFFGREGLGWEKLTKRYVFSEHLFPFLDKAVSNFRKKQKTIDSNRRQWAEAFRKNNIALTVLTPNIKVSTGLTHLFALLLPKGFPYSSHEVYRVAVASKIPLLLQPVNPAYLEAAWKRSYISCQNAEDISKRLLFLPSVITADIELLAPEFIRFFNALLNIELDFKYPYNTSGSPMEIPKEYEHLRTHGIISKSIDGIFYILDQLYGKLYQIPSGLVKSLQAIAEIR